MNFRSAFGPALGCSLKYLSIYALAGVFLIPIASGVASRWEQLVVLAHLVSAVALLPASLLVSMALHEWIGPAPSKRLWLTGIVAVPVVWYGTLFCLRNIAMPYGLLRPIFGDWTKGVVMFGWAALLSNLALLITWLVPRRGRS